MFEEEGGMKEEVVLLRAGSPRLLLGTDLAPCFAHCRNRVREDLAREREEEVENAHERRRLGMMI